MSGGVAGLALCRLRRDHPDVAVRQEAFGWVARVDGREYPSTDLVFLRMLLENRPRREALPVRWTPRGIL